MYLNCHTHYSLRYGTISEKDLLAVAEDYGVKRLALTDINSTTVALNTIRLSRDTDITIVPGVDCRRGAYQLYVAIAQSNRGYQALNEFLSEFLHAHEELPLLAPDLVDVVFIYPFERLINEKIEPTGDHRIGVSRHMLSRLPLSSYAQSPDQLVAFDTMTFRSKREYNTHRLLRAIDANALLSKLSVDNQGKETDRYLSPAELREAYGEHAYLLDNAERLLAKCNVQFDFSDRRPHQNKKSYTGDPKQDLQLIKELCRKGLDHRYDTITPEIEARLQKELDMIIRMDYVPFFLVNWDIISYAKRQGYFHVGRGSGANSIVAYLLGITDVDPTELDLYFERFMNLYRSSPPDFDIDFSWRDREDVTRYIFERFGSQNQVALLATYSTFQYNAAIRELGKVFGLPKEEIDKLAKGNYRLERLDQLNRLVVTYAQEIDGMPNYLSIHAGGIIISERSLHYFTATHLPPKGFPTVQFDMVIAEDVGLYKYDILAQRGLGKIKDAVALIKQNHPEAQSLDIHNAKPFFTDPKVVEMISSAQCTGCFYVESPAMRMLLRKLEVKTYLGLVAASSIIRPGVAKSGMMREYILRHKDPSRVKHAHPIMLDIMPDTYGIMVYQEDVIKVAHHFADLTLGEADVLRRGMSGKYRSREEFQQVRDKFFANCREKGHSSQITKEVWHQIESFAGYAFAKGHSASYAVESYQCLYLKAHYPIEYMTAVINNGGGFYRVETYLHEMRAYGALIHAPCVNHSGGLTVTNGNDVYLGLGLLQGLETSTILQIIRSRESDGTFLTFEDFIDRVKIGVEQLDILIRINALRYTGKSKQELLWRVRYYENGKKEKEAQTKMFGVPQFEFTLPDLEVTALQDAYDEMELLGFPLGSTYDLLLEAPPAYILATQMPNYQGGTITMVGYLVTVKNTRTSSGKRMQFGTFLDVEEEWIDTVHFPPIAARYPFTGRGIYLLRGKVMEEFGYYTLEVSYMEKLPYRSFEE